MAWNIEVRLSFGIIVSCTALMCAAATQAKPVVRISPDAPSHVYKPGATAVVKISVENAPEDGNAEIWADDGWTNVVWRHALVFSNETSVAATLTRSTPGSFRIHVKGGGFKERMDRVLFGANKRRRWHYRHRSTGRLIAPHRQVSLTPHEA